MKTPDTHRAGLITAVLAGLVLTPLVLPWRHIAHHCFREPAERFR